MKRELNVQANMKTKNSKNLKIKALVDSGCMHTGIDKQLVKEKQIQIKSINFSFEVFDIDRTKNEEITKMVPLEIEINGHKEQLKATIMNLNGHDWLIKYNPEVNMEEIPILGVIVGKEQVKMEQEKIKAVE